MTMERRWNWSRIQMTGKVSKRLNALMMKM
jgi:hypothetical protein